ncbi:mCG54345 [Mus musculus]|uniref:Uncharacterized protein n=1 Tax=Mus musculus TaxID=10090 RepID=Q9CX45_MOUSE|nr:mCG54345 [Mus musculus]BAB32025.1 unnamed protein product [Mus musculus]|eukprot:NP_084149.1 uncharacterized protein LOC77166 [Mus musculus]
MLAPKHTARPLRQPQYRDFLSDFRLHHEQHCGPSPCWRSSGVWESHAPACVVPEEEDFYDGQHLSLAAVSPAMRETHTQADELSRDNESMRREQMPWEGSSCRSFSLADSQLQRRSRYSVLTQSCRRLPSESHCIFSRFQNR